MKYVPYTNKFFIYYAQNWSNFNKKRRQVQNNQNYTIIPRQNANQIDGGFGT